jgi:hypothetical protein
MLIGGKLAKMHISVTVTLKIQNTTFVIVLPFIVRLIKIFYGIFIYLHVMLLILHFLILFSSVFIIASLLVWV